MKTVENLFIWKNFSSKNESFSTPFLMTNALRESFSFKQNPFHLIKRKYCTNKFFSSGENPFHFMLFLIKGERRWTIVKNNYHQGQQNLICMSAHLARVHICATNNWSTSKALVMWKCTKLFNNIIVNFLLTNSDWLHATLLISKFIFIASIARYQFEYVRLLDSKFVNI